MKTGIHPAFTDECTVKCSCGATFIIGSTLPELKVEICSNCHPFYTGEQGKLVDTERRVEKFMKRQEMAAAVKKTPMPKVMKEEEAKEDLKTAEEEDKNTEEAAA